MTPRVLVAGIGNIFFGDDGFGVAVVKRLQERPIPLGVSVVDFGIRGLDLAYTLLEEWDGAILVDAIGHRGPPGSLVVLEPDDPGVRPEALSVEGHSLDPARVLAFVRALGGVVPLVRVVGCVPLHLGSDDDPALGLSGPVAAAVDPAAELVLSLVAGIQAAHHA